MTRAAGGFGRAGRFVAGRPIRLAKPAVGRVALRSVRLMKLTARLAASRLSGSARWPAGFVTRRPSRPTGLAARDAGGSRLTGPVARRSAWLAGLAAGAIVLAGCHGGGPVRRLGYVEADRVRVSAEAPGKLTRLGCRDGQTVPPEAPLFDVESTAGTQTVRRTVRPPVGGVVERTYFREGEWVTPGTPVLSLLPQGSRFARFWAPAPAIAGLKLGDPVQVFLEGGAAPVPARLRYVASEPEYAPPMLYDREHRDTLLFMVEAALPEAEAAPPGLPLEAELPAR